MKGWLALAACALLAAAGACAGDGTTTALDEICPEAQRPPTLTCGGLRGGTCPKGMVCLDAPNDGCDPKTAADCPGTCQYDVPVACGGIAGAICPDMLACLDVPNDGCDPKRGGRDCPGLCLRCNP